MGTAQPFICDEKKHNNKQTKTEWKQPLVVVFCFCLFVCLFVFVVYLIILFVVVVVVAFLLASI